MKPSQASEALNKGYLDKTSAHERDEVARPAATVTTSEIYGGAVGQLSSKRSTVERREGTYRHTNLLHGVTFTNRDRIVLRRVIICCDGERSTDFI
jgi:hypothetical protein